MCAFMILQVTSWIEKLVWCALCRYINKKVKSLWTVWNRSRRWDTHIYKRNTLIYLGRTKTTAPTAMLSMRLFILRRRRRRKKTAFVWSWMKISQSTSLQYNEQRMRKKLCDAKTISLKSKLFLRLYTKIAVLQSYRCIWFLSISILEL